MLRRFLLYHQVWKNLKEIATKDEYKYVVENDDIIEAKEKIAKIIKEHRTNQGH